MLADDFSFGLKPVFHLMAWHLATLQVKRIGPVLNGLLARNGRSLFGGRLLRLSGGSFVFHTVLRYVIAQ